MFIESFANRMEEASRLDKMHLLSLQNIWKMSSVHILDPLHDMEHEYYNIIPPIIGDLFSSRKRRLLLLYPQLHRNLAQFGTCEAQFSAHWLLPFRRNYCCGCCCSMSSLSHLDFRSSYNSMYSM